MAPNLSIVKAGERSGNSISSHRFLKPQYGDDVCWSELTLTFIAAQNERVVHARENLMPPIPQFRARRTTRIRGYQADARRAASNNDIRQVVGHLRYGHLDPNGRELRIASHGTVRLDRQANTTDGAANLQVQLNDTPGGRRNTGGTTIGQVLIPPDVYDLAHSHPIDSGVREQLTSVTRSALIQSCDSGGYTYVIEVDE